MKNLLFAAIIFTIISCNDGGNTGEEKVLPAPVRDKLLHGDVKDSVKESKTVALNKK